jgi:hypothetical protein
MPGLLLGETTASVRPGSAPRQRYIQSNIAHQELKNPGRVRPSAQGDAGSSLCRRIHVRIGDRAGDARA